MNLNVKFTEQDSSFNTEFDNLQTINGKDGISASHSWDGTVLTVTSASGTSSADLKGADGKDGQNGYTPVKGTDYWNEADKAEIVEETVENIPTASTDTKGVVKVGDGLTMTGDVLSVEEGEYELIETITTEEEVSEIFCKYDTSYKQMLVTVAFRGSISGVCYIHCMNKAWAGASCGTSWLSLTDANYGIKAIFRQVGGTWDVYGYHGYQGSMSNMVGQTNAYVLHTVKDFAWLEWVRVYNLSANFPIGTVINIYGVKA